MSNKNKNTILFIFYDFSLSHTFFLFSYTFCHCLLLFAITHDVCCSLHSSFPSARAIWSAVIPFLFIIFFIVNLFKCSHCHLLPSGYIFFFWPTPTRPRHAAVTLWRPHTVRPCALWHQGLHLLLGGVSHLLRHQNVLLVHLGFSNPFLYL